MMRYLLLAALLVLPLASCTGTKTPRGLDSLAEVNIRKGQTYLADKNYDSALTCFEEALKHEPANMTALVGRGQAYAGKGNYDQAIADFDAVPDTDPNSGLAHLYRGLASAEKEDDYNTVVKPQLDAAKQRDLHGINADQELATVYARHGDKYQEAQDLENAFEKAAACYDIAETLVPDSALYRYHAAVIYDRLKDWNRAITEYDEAVRLGEPAENVARPLSVALLNRARSFKANNQREQAQADFKRALLLNPNLQKYDDEFK